MPVQTKEDTRNTNQTDNADGEKDNSSRAAFSATSEFLFVILPFIVIAITLAYRGQFNTILALPEWSIVSAVIAGQAVVKLASIGIGRKVKRENITLVLSSLLVFLLVPVLIILAIALTSSNMSIGLEVAQGVLFILSSFVFWGTSYLKSWIIPENN